jgi:hypothetical protein
MKQPATKPGILRSAKFQALLAAATSVATTLAIVALPVTKKPPGFGE